MIERCANLIIFRQQYWRVFISSAGWLQAELSCLISVWSQRKQQLEHLASVKTFYYSQIIALFYLNYQSLS